MDEERTRTHRDLVVWQRSLDLVDEIYTLARRVPDAERFGLTSQLTRAAVSVPANIAEGHGRTGAREFANFVSIARGSLAELDSLVEVALRPGYASPAEAERLGANIETVGRMLKALSRRIREASG